MTTKLPVPRLPGRDSHSRAYENGNGGRKAGAGHFQNYARSRNDAVATRAIILWALTEPSALRYSEAPADQIILLFICATQMKGDPLPSEQMSIDVFGRT